MTKLKCLAPILAMRQSAICPLIVGAVLGASVATSVGATTPAFKNPPAAENPPLAKYAQANVGQSEGPGSSENAGAGSTVKTSVVEQDQPAAPKKFKAQIATYYYNLEGTRAANQNLYNFGNITIRADMLTLQYTASPKWTLMASGQWLETFVETQIFGLNFKDSTIGFGDTYLLAMRPLWMSQQFFVFTDFGVSLPTGDISKKNQSNKAVNYPYNMQLGSGTYDAMVAVSPVWMKPPYQVGSRLSTIVRTGENDNGYRLGNQYKLDAWAEYETTVGLAPRLVGYYKHRDRISGADKTLGRIPFLEFYHHTQINWDVSAALRFKKLFMKSFELAVEGGLPLFQESRNIDNVRVSTQYYGSLGLSGFF